MADWHKRLSPYLRMLHHLASLLWHKLLLALVGGWYLVREQVWDRHRRLPSLPDQEGRLVVVTGGGRGIGEKAVRKLVGLGCRVVVGVRSPDSVRQVFEDCGSSVQVLPLDLLSMASVRAFATQVLELGPVHVLINNAGIMFGGRKETEEGHEYQLCTNYLGHFLLSHLLLPALSTAGRQDRAARIVNVSSCAHLLGSWMDFSDLQSKRSYIPEQAYGNSKAAQLMFAAQLDRLLVARGEHVKVSSLHPGVIYTDLYSNVPGIKFISALCKLVMKSPAQGGDTLVAAALDPALETLQGAQYLVNSQPASQSAFTRDRGNQARLWEATTGLLDIPHDQFGL